MIFNKKILGNGIKPEKMGHTPDFQLPIQGTVQHHLQCKLLKSVVEGGGGLF